MRHLILLRHAKTERQSDSGEDHDRRIDARGRGDSALIGAWLAAQHPQPELALISDATRTHETWEIVGSHLSGCGAEFLDTLYLASAMKIFKTIRRAPNSVVSLLVLGHNPGLHELAWNLAGEANATERAALAENLPTCGAVVLEYPVSTWGEVALHKGRMCAFVTPKQLQASSDVP